MKDTKIVLFDFDGTIADTLESGLTVLDDLSEEYGFNKFRPHLDRLRGMSAKQIYKEWGVPLYKIAIITRRARKEFAKQIPFQKPIEGIGEEIREIKNLGYSISILSSNSEENVREFLRNNDLDIFDDIYSGVSIFGKHRLLKKFAHDKRVNPDQIVYVADEARDIEAAKRENINMIAVTWGYNLRGILEEGNPDHIIDRPEELVQIVKSFKR
ncbi:MAG: carotenoid oxygenase [Candidatus Colwellbacteria bacterium CG10_big_fil_rev_8_21_14_0_10_41_28]|uniref:Carotenoid oxygenase n=1 Tax=Candidatus Colwellbacteria bacterium CG10_big_fil_rev_8_21_14_0_10_41_28 TaxID=1974539 RepID=A0A2H0VHM8_9BACT|nr:MAG: carotenoid oxygenase [Candidatus Colwellbacteria bacterium CG10_big_fil_rev_8_21_14_0_10_41_28]